MIFINELVKCLQNNKINFFTGVPDSCLKVLTSFLESPPSDPDEYFDSGSGQQPCISQLVLTT